MISTYQPRSTRTNPAPARGVISQDLLEEYLRLGEAKRRHERVREELIALLNADAVIEFGPLSVSLHLESSRRLTASSLIPVLGKDEVDRLKAQIEPTVCRYLDVKEVQASRDNWPVEDESLRHADGRPILFPGIERSAG